MNFTHIAGHLGADPETRFTSTGKKVTTLRVACRTRKGQNDDTIWWRVTIWGEQYDKMIPYLKKGSAVVVAGELHKPEIFNDREGKPQVSMEITASFVTFSPFGGKPGGGQATAPGQTQGSADGQHQQHQAPGGGFGSFHDAPSSPYMQGGSSAGAPKGDTFNDEVPF